MAKHPILMGISVDHEEKRLVKLSKCKKMIISNRHLRELYSDVSIKKKIIAILLELNKEEVFSMCLNTTTTKKNRGDDENVTSSTVFKDSEVLYIPFGNESWKCKLCIRWSEIETFRDWMCGIEKHSGRTNWTKCRRLMIRDLKFVKYTKPIELRELEDEEDEERDVKKSFVFKYEHTSVAPIELTVHIYSKN